jgi:membrane protein implicated in regulation of membrane protease activity
VDLLGVNLGQFNWVIFIIGGFIGALLVFFIFDWALILLSALTGAGMVVEAAGLQGAVNSLAFLVLVLAGVVVQAAAMRRDQRREQRLQQPSESG